MRLQTRSIGPTHKNTLASKINLGTLLRQRGDIDEALELHKSAYEGSVKSLGGDHVSTLLAGSCYAQTLLAARKLDAAIDLLVPVVESFNRLSGPSSNDTVTARRLLSRIYRERGQNGKAKQQLQLALKSLLNDGQASRRMIRRVRTELEALD